MIRINRTTGLVAVSALAAIGLLALLALGTSAGGSATAADASATSLDDHDEDRYSVVQGDRCIQIEPMGDGGQTAEDHYDYRNPNTTPQSYTYSSHGTTHLQEDDTSILYLHEGSDGLSLVIVHDRYDGFTDGGAATFQIDGLPQDGEWVVEDDNYDGADAEWDHSATSSRITWVWSEARTDGGAFNGGLDDEFAIEISPAFNEFADFQVYDGEVDDWQVLSAPEHEPERTSLDLHQSIEIRSGGCTVVTDLDVDETVDAGNSTDVTATVSNDGVHNETVTVPIEVDGEVVDEHELTLESGETATVTSTVEFDEAGDVTVSAGGVTADVTVSDAAGAMDQLPGFGVAVAVTAIFVALFLARRR